MITSKCYIIKRAALVIFILFTIAHRNAECSPFIAGYISYIYSNESTATKNNHSIGYELLFLGTELYAFDIFHSPGIFIRGLNNTASLELKYDFKFLFFECIGIGPRINITMGNNFCISPQLDFTLFFWASSFNFAYRHNIYFNQTNSHEFCFSVSVIGLFTGNLSAIIPMLFFWI